MLDKRYDHLQVEEGKYEKWKEGGYFTAGDKSKQPFIHGKIRRKISKIPAVDPYYVSARI